MTVVLEIRTYRLAPGTVDEFLALMREQALPLLLEVGIDVVALGPSLDDDGEPQVDSYLMRTFASIEERAAAEEAFYGSERWIDGPREAILSRIESFHTIVLEVPAAVVEGLRDEFATPP